MSNGTLNANEPHPMAYAAQRWVAKYTADPANVFTQEALASCALSGNRAAGVCGETLRRLQAGEPVSDRYVLGLAWMLRDMEDMSDETVCD